MIDKQIIIDGVDVSGCEFYSTKTGYCLRNKNLICNCDDDANYNLNCSYKNWKRKEQECEELKAELELFKTSNQTTIDQLKAENEELKEINSTLLEYRRHAVTCQDCYEDGLEDGKTSNKELRKLKQTLTEIREIIKFNKTNRLSGGGDISIEQILQKINECEIINE